MHGNCSQQYWYHQFWKSNKTLVFKRFLALLFKLSGRGKKEKSCRWLREPWNISSKRQRLEFWALKLLKICVGFLNWYIKKKNKGKIRRTVKGCRWHLDQFFSFLSPLSVFLCLIFRQEAERPKLKCCWLIVRKDSFFLDFLFTHNSPLSPMSVLFSKELTWRVSFLISLR